MARNPRTSRNISPQDAPARRGPGARRVGGFRIISRLQNLLALHLQVMTGSLMQFVRAPLSSLMTAMVIGIALALPAALHVFLDKMQVLSGGWTESARISLFLKEDVSDDKAEGLANELRGWSQISRVDHITPAQALAEFQAQSGLGEALSLLDENPLPGVLVVTPSQANRAPVPAEALLDRLQQQPIVDLAQMDLEWVQRLHGLLHLAERGALVLGGLLALAVLFVVGNTIRLAIQSRHAEIEVIKLIGGSDAFVRRPFLYSGMWSGLFGGLVAWGLVNTVLVSLAAPVKGLAVLYGSTFTLGVMDMQTTLILLFSGPILGLSGAGLVAGRRIRAIEPV